MKVLLVNKFHYRKGGGETYYFDLAEGLRSLGHGDTTTSFAAALAAFYLHIPVGHVEAGLRTRNLYSPWPEEFNRQAVDVVSRWYFAPTEAARRNLLDEAKPSGRIFVTGNTGIDALRTTVREGYSHPLLDWAAGSRLVLDFHNLLARCRLVLTDSGGIQEEAPGLGKPVLVMRDTTERPEGVEAGTLKLVGTDEEAIYEEFSRLLDNPAAYAEMAHASNPYGDGYASRRIADVPT